MTANAALLPDRSVSGSRRRGSRSFLQGLVTNDVEGLGEGEARFAGLLSPQGKILFDFFIVLCRRNLSYRLLQRHQRADLAKRLALYRLRAKVTIADVSDRWRVGAAWGEGAAGVGRRQTRRWLIPIRACQR